MSEVDNEVNNNVVERYAQSHNISEQEAEAFITNEIIRIAKMLAPKHQFGYYSVEDIIGQACLIGWEGLQRYDVSRPLPNFLYSHIRNRLINFKRDKFIRSEPPCECCDPFNPPMYPCKKWEKWYKRNTSKAKLCSMMGTDNEIEISSGTDPLDVLIWEETQNLIMEKLPDYLHDDYHDMMDGLNIDENNSNEIREILRDIL